MTTVGMAGYLRAESALWRDTGRHVLVLKAGKGSRLTVLAGGSAALWRLLIKPRSMPEILACLVDNHGAADEVEVADAVETLVASGLVRVEGVA